MAAATFVLVLGFAAVPCLAQLVASRDLTTGWRVPSEHIAIPETCDKPRASVIDGDQAKAGTVTAKNLELTIVDTSPAKLEIGNDFNATVRLKNIGTTPVLVPSVADGEQVLRSVANAHEEKYEVADISFRLTTGMPHSIPIYLNTAGALFANPDDKASYLALQPGKWLEIKLHARVECGMENCMGEIQPDSKATLSAWWYQRVLSHRVTGCEDTHGSFTVRELDSSPFTVEVTEPTPKMSAAVRNY
ncbi:MAG: hypothetical protein ACRD3P_15050 [Terriglobales bacterium]